MTVDNRIVEMQFNNQQFEQNISKSITSLENLKKGLDLEGAIKGLQGIESAFKGFTLDPIANTLEELNSKFDAMSDAGVRALNRIKDQAIDAGISLVKSLSIDQAGAGFSKYEAKTQAIATMQYAIKGGKTEEGTKRIYEQIENLQHYADETSYDFSSMVDGMSKFIAAGAGLEDAEKSMEGIANWAAMAGVSAQSGKFKTVVQQLSQAAGTGVVKFQDWSSIETATMATEGFRKRLIETAKEAGNLVEVDGKLYAAGVKLTKKNKEQHEVTAGNMSATLKDGWLTFDLLQKILKEYANDPEAFKAAQVARTFTDAIESAKDAVSTGWSKSAELVFGDVNQSAEFFTDLANAMIDATDELTSFRNGVLQVWNTAGGRTALIDAFWNIWNILGAIGNSFKEAFGIGEPLIDALGNRLADMTKRLNETTASVLGLFESIKKVTGGESKKTSKSINQVTSDLTGLQEEARKNAVAVEGMINTGTVKMSEKTAANFQELADAYKDLDEYIASGEVDADELQAKLDNINRLLEVTGSTNKLMTRKKNALQAMKDQLKGYSEAGFESQQITKETTEELTEEEEEIYYRSQRLVEIFSGLKDLFGIFTDAVGAVKDGFFELAGMFAPFITPVLNLTTAFARYISMTRKSLKANKVFTKHVNQMNDALSPITDTIEPIAEKLNTFAWSAFTALQTGSFGETKIGKVLSGIGSGANIASRGMSHLVYLGSTLLTKFVAPMAGRFGNWLLDKFSSLGSWLTQLDTALKNNNVFGKIRDAIDQLGQWLDTNLDPYLKKIEEFISPITSTINEFFGATGSGLIAAIDADTTDEETLKGKIEKRLQAFQNAFTDTKIGQLAQTVKEKIDGFLLTIKPITDAIAGFFRDTGTALYAAMTADVRPEGFYENRDEYAPASLSEQITARLDAFEKAFAETELGKKVETVKEKIASFTEAITPIVSAVTGFFNDTGSSLFAAITVDTSEEETLKDKIGQRLSTFENTFNSTELGQRVQTITKKIEEFFQPLLTAIEPITRPIGEFLGHFWDGALAALTGESKPDRFYENLDEYTDTSLIDQIRQRLDIFAAAFENDELVGKVKDIAGKVSSFFEPLSGGFEGIKQFFQDLWSLLSGMFSGIGGDPSQKTEEGGTSITESLGNLEDVAEHAKATGGVLSTAGGVVWDVIKWFVNGIADMIHEAVSKFSIGDVWKFQQMMGSLRRVIAGVEFKQAITNMLDGVKEATESITGKVESVGGLFKKKESKLDTFKKIATGIMELGAGIWMMADAVAKLAAIELLPDDDGSGIIGGVGSLLTILGALALFLNNTSGEGSKDEIKSLMNGGLTTSIQQWISEKGGFGIKTGAAVMELAQALRMMADAVKTLSDIPPIPDEDASGLLGGVGSLLVILWGLSRFLNGYDGGDIIQKMSKGKGLFASIEKTTEKNGVFGVNTGTAVMELGQGIKLMSEAVSTLAGIQLLPASLDDESGLLAGISSLLILLAGLSMFLNGTGNGASKDEIKSLSSGGLITSIQTWISEKGGFGVLTGAAVMELAQALKMMADAVQSLSDIKPVSDDGSGLVAGMVSILTLLGALSLFLNGTGSKTTEQSTKGKGLFAAITELTEKTGVLSPITGAAVMELANALNTMADAITKLSAIEALPDEDGSGLVGGVGSIITILAALGIFLNKTDMGEQNADIAQAIAGITGTEVGKDLESLGNFLNKTADAIVKLSNVNVVDEEDGHGVVAGVGSILAVLGGLGLFLNHTDFGSGGTGFGKFLQNGIAGITGGTELGADLDHLGEFLNKSADAIVKLSGLEVVDKEDGHGVVAGVGSILAIIGGVAGLFAADKALKTNIKDGVTQVMQGEAFVLIADAVEKLASSTEKIATMAKSEDKDLVGAMFVEGGMLGGIAVLATTLGKVPITEAIATVANLGVFIGGFTAVFTALGELTSFLSANGIDVVKDLGTAGDVMEALGNAVGRLIGGLGKGIFGEKTPEEDGEYYTALATELSQFSDIAAKLNVHAIDNAIRIFERLGDVVSVAEGDASWFGSTGTALTPLQSFLSDFEQVGHSLETFSAYLMNFDIAKAESATTMISNLINLAKMMSETKFEGSENGVDSWEGAINFMTQMFDALTMNEQFGSGIGEFAGNVITGMADAIANGGGQVDTSVIQVINNAITSAGQMVPSFTSIGENISIGLGNGVYNEAGFAYRAVATVVQGMLTTAQNTAVVQSPSKVTTWMGEMITQGLAIGVLNEAPMAYDSAKTVAEQTLAQLSTVMAEDVSARPTIRPVLDLTDVYTGLDTLNAMTPGMRLSGLAPNLSALRASAIGEIRTHNDDADVVAAIERLGERLDTFEETMSSLSIVLDTGATVGGLAPSMNREFGSMALLDERNI